MSRQRKVQPQAKAKKQAEKPRIVAANGNHSPLKICHWSSFNQSGMHKVAETLMKAERKIGLDSYLINVQEVPSEQWDRYADADVHVPHTHFPNEMKKRLTKPFKMVFIPHGVPEYILNSAFEETKRGYGHSDPLMLYMHWMKVADAIVTFWPRHQAIIKSMCDKNTPVLLSPMGLDIDFWKAARSRGKFAGNPSVMTCENSHSIKWGYDLFVCWSWIYDVIPDACLHANYLPQDQHRVWMPLLDRNGCGYGAFISPLTWTHEELRHVLNSVDFYWNGVRYGDFNRMGMEANLSGTKVISYRGNPYSHFWITEGDQREMAKEFIEIFKGEREPRTPEPIPSDVEMAQFFKGVYESIL